MVELPRENPEHEFIRRTLRIVESHSEYSCEVTLQINCLLGLVVMPKEAKLLEKIPNKPYRDELKGIEVLRDNRPKEDTHNPHTLKGLVYHLRNALAHLREIDTKSENGRIKEVIFRNEYKRDEYTCPNCKRVSGGINIDVKISIDVGCIQRLMKAIVRHLDT